jgi:hypothetical protein
MTAPNRGLMDPRDKPGDDIGLVGAVAVAVAVAAEAEAEAEADGLARIECPSTVILGLGPGTYGSARPVLVVGRGCFNLAPQHHRPKSWLDGSPRQARG